MSDLWAELVVFGLILIITPLVLALRAGVLEEDEFVHWLTSLPERQIFFFAGAPLSGVLFYGGAELCLDWGSKECRPAGTAYEVGWRKEPVLPG